MKTVTRAEHIRYSFLLTARIFLDIIKVLLVAVWAFCLFSGGAAGLWAVVCGIVGLIFAAIL